MLTLIAEAATWGGKILEVQGKITPLLEVGSVIQVFNRTRTTVGLLPGPVASGEFIEPPDNTIPPDQVSTFGVKGLLGTSGRVLYNSNDPGLFFGYEVSWDVPRIGEPTGNGVVTGGAAPYLAAKKSIGNQKMKHDLIERPTEKGWRRCLKCGTLNHQTNGLDSVCVAGGTHDDAGQAYQVIQGGAMILPSRLANWKRCRKCSCMVAIPGTAPCHAGSMHDLENANYTLVADAAAPGQAGWLFCGICCGLVRDTTLRCPGPVASHIVAPLPVVTVRLE
ncbi:hypothetical protein [Hyphomonas sp.]|jgi:hypothetical protein|uniref:hypothetical protein n=1 Tax=Hyphomonas sp. TaxID=87 RepID=UPI0037BF1B83